MNIPAKPPVTKQPRKPSEASPNLPKDATASTDSSNKRLKKWHKALLALLVIAALATIGGIAGFNYWYQQNIKAVNATVVEGKVVTIQPGANVKLIAQQLNDEGVVRSARAFEIYVTRAGLRTNLQAGTYKFSPSQSVERIVAMLKNGEVDKSYITIPPGLRLAEIKDIFKKAGYSEQQIDEGFAADQYRNHISLKDLPKGATLEGYIYPETFRIDAGVTVKAIVDNALTELDKQLTNDVVAKLTSKNLNLHQAFTLASMIEKETNVLSDRPTVAQVFLKRYDEGIMLGSDVTFIYAAKEAGVEPRVNIDSPYNTRLYKGLPPGPISNFFKSSIDALANPSDTDFLYFVAGDDGRTHYGKTEAEHEENIRKYCTKLCQ